MSAKLVTPDLLKIKVSSRNNVCDAIIVDYDVINKILSRDSSYNADLVMWAEFGHFRITMREVIVTSILQGFDQKN